MTPHPEISAPSIFSIGEMEVPAKGADGIPIRTCLFDLDDTLYSGLAPHCCRNIEDYMVERLGFSRDNVQEESVRLYKEYGTSMAGLRAHGYEFDFDDWHSFVHGRLPYHLLKLDPALRALVESLPQRKFIFTNADRQHAHRCLQALGLAGCFERVIAFEDVMGHGAYRTFNQRDVVGRYSQSTASSPPSSAFSGSPPASSSPSLPNPCLSSSPLSETPAAAAAGTGAAPAAAAAAAACISGVRCSSRRCISVDGLVEQGVAQSLAAAEVAQAAASSCTDDPASSSSSSSSSCVSASWQISVGPLVCCKPQAEAFQRALAMAGGADPKSTVFLDDSIRNIAAAKKFGLQTVLVGTPQLTPESDMAISDVLQLRKAMPNLWQWSGTDDAEEGLVNGPCLCHLSTHPMLVQA